MSQFARICVVAVIALPAVALILYTLGAIRAGRVRSIGVVLAAAIGAISSGVGPRGVPRLPPAIERERSGAIFWRVVCINALVGVVLAYFAIRTWHHGL